MAQTKYSERHRKEYLSIIKDLSTGDKLKYMLESFFREAVFHNVFSGEREKYREKTCLLIFLNSLNQRPYWEIEKMDHVSYGNQLIKIEQLLDESKDKKRYINKTMSYLNGFYEFVLEKTNIQVVKENLDYWKRTIEEDASKITMSDKKKKQIIVQIDNLFHEPQLTNLIKEFIKFEFFSKEFKNTSSKEKMYKAIELFLKSMDFITGIEDLGWQTYLNQIKILESNFLTEWEKLVKVTTKKLIENFYIYGIENTKLVSVQDNLKEWQKLHSKCELVASDLTSKNNPKKVKNPKGQSEPQITDLVRKELFDLLEQLIKNYSIKEVIKVIFNNEISNKKFISHHHKHIVIKSYRHFIHNMTTLNNVTSISVMHYLDQFEIVELEDNNYKTWHARFLNLFYLYAGNHSENVSLFSEINKFEWLYIGAGDSIHFTVKQLMEIKNALVNIKVSSEVNKLILNFLEELLFVEFPSSNERVQQKVNILNFLYVLQNDIFQISDFNWENYCNLMESYRKLPKSVNFKKNTRELISGFYIYASHKVSDTKVRKYIRTNKKLFISNEVLGPNDKLNNFQKITSNFPLNTSENHILSVGITKNGVIKSFSNINVNTENFFVRKILGKFIKHSLETRYLNDFRYRLFFYYFEQSLKQIEKAIKRIKDFNFDTLYYQYQFYKSVDSEHNFKPSNSVVSILKKFYLFLDDIYFEDNGTYLFNTSRLNKFLLEKQSFFRDLDDGYFPIYKSSQGTMPHNDRWLIQFDTNKPSARYGSYYSTLRFDFSKVVDKELIEDLKVYIWNRKDTHERLNGPVLINFLNSATNYLNENKNVIPLHGVQRLFSNDFILKYRVAIEMRITKNSNKVKSGTINEELKEIRGYLRFYKEKYQITEITIQQLTSNKKIYNGGNPMTANDFEVIKAAMLEKRGIVENGELFFIIFKLATTTKLRLGEILNLERNCVLFKSEALGYGEVQYFSKTSYGELLTEEFLIEDIHLIDNAIKLTEEIQENAHLDLKKFIFLTYMKRNKRTVKRMSYEFCEYFNDIVESQYEKGQLENRYTPNNSRHTFINSAWQAVEDNLISSLEIGILTGNTAQVASQSYRKYQTKRFIEATYMITIGDVDIKGEITENEKDIEELQQVNEGAGGCLVNDCIKKEDDNEDKCLTCRKFATSLSRISIFENKLEEIQNRILSSESKVEKNYLSAKKKLYSVYLFALYNKLEERKDKEMNAEKIH